MPRSTSIAFLVGLTLARVASAQTPAPCPPVTDTALLLPCQADRGHVETGRVTPRYPSTLESNGIRGEVHVRYAVDTAGRTVPGSLEIVASTHELFTASVRVPFQRWRFTPWTYRGRPVAVRYEEVFQFTGDGRSNAEAVPMTDPVAVHDTTPAGLPRTRIGERYETADPEATFSWAELRYAQLQAIATVLKEIHVDSLTACVETLLDSTRRIIPDSAFLATLSVPTRRAVRSNYCPKTYAPSMIAGPTPPPAAPAGWIDPYYVDVERAIPWKTWLIAVDVRIRQGTSSSHYRCGIRKANLWITLCKRLPGFEIS